MKWLTLSLLLTVACAGRDFKTSEDTFQDGSSGSGDMAGIVPTIVQGGHTSTGGSMNGGSAGVASTIGGMPPVAAAGDGGEPGTSESVGGLGGTPGDVMPSCSESLVWTVACSSDTPIFYIVYNDQLWFNENGPTDCNGHCPPPSPGREPYCDSTVYVYQLVGPC